VSRRFYTQPMNARRFFCLLALLATAVTVSARQRPSGRVDWTRFRGPNGSGHSTAAQVPTEFGPAKNLAWKIALPPGHSSPILFGDRLYLTAFRGDSLVTIAVDRIKGRILWEREAPRVKPVVVDKRNNPASPSPAVEENAVYVFFPDYGLIAYDAAGKERWTMALGPFNNVYGMGASPVIVGNLLILACDQSIGSYLMAVDKGTGKMKWKTLRPEARSGHATPIVWRAPDGRDQLLLPGSFFLTAYDVATGEKRWWVHGLSFEIKSTPVIAGDTIFINGYGSQDNDPGRKIVVPPSAEVWGTADKDKNGVLSKLEFPKYSAPFWFDFVDLDANGSLSPDEWEYYRAALDSENGMLAIRLGGKGDMTSTAVKWKYQRSVPQLPSPLLFKNILYMANDNGIVTALNPETGALIRQARLTQKPENIFASPVEAGGHVYFVTERGAVAVLPESGDLTPMVVNELNEDCYATPAFADGRIYIRTTQALYAFGVTIE
jgi:outer membrane protein assembly factor BamB